MKQPFPHIHQRAYSTRSPLTSRASKDPPRREWHFDSITFSVANVRKRRFTTGCTSVRLSDQARLKFIRVYKKLPIYDKQKIMNKKPWTTLRTLFMKNLTALSGMQIVWFCVQYFYYSADNFIFMARHLDST